MMPRLCEVQPRPGYCLWLRYDDDVQGALDLSQLVGRGVFAAWTDEAAFLKVSVGLQGQPLWDNGLDLCPDALYLQLTGKDATELFPGLALAVAHA